MCFSSMFEYFSKKEKNNRKFAREKLFLFFSSFLLKLVKNKFTHTHAPSTEGKPVKTESKIAYPSNNLFFSPPFSRESWCCYMFFTFSAVYRGYENFFNGF